MLQKRLRELRESTGLSARKFAETIGIKYTTYYGYETGAREPGSDFISMIADHFGVTTDYILCRSKPTTAKETHFSPEESVMIQKYRILDEHGKEIVDVVLEKEHERMQQQAAYEEEDIEAQVESYRQELLAEQKAAEKSSVLPKDA